MTILIDTPSFRGFGFGQNGSLLAILLAVITGVSTSSSAKGDETILFQDTFNPTQSNPNSENVNFRIADRQFGRLAPITYTKGFASTFSQVGNPEAVNQLLLADRTLDDSGRYRSITIFWRHLAWAPLGQSSSMSIR